VWRRRKFAGTTTWRLRWAVLLWLMKVLSLRQIACLHNPLKMLHAISELLDITK
jgi:hypothetical protein